MLKTLIKKQFMELFRGYFVDQKTGKARTKSRTVLLFIVFGFLFVFLGGTFFGLSAALGAPLFSLGLEWLYFALVALIATFLGVFGSVFNTYSSLYLSKDNELLISLPIPPGRILLSRMLSVYLLGLLYSGIVWIPAVIYYFIAGAPSVTAIILCVVLTFFLAGFVMVLTCFFGWLVAMISVRLKNKSFVIVILSVVLIGAYYYVSFQFTSLLERVIENSQALAENVRKYMNYYYQLGRGATGEILPALLFIGITAALMAVTVWILSRTFIRIATKTPASRKAVYREKRTAQKGILGTLLTREVRRFTKSPTYMLNCGFGIFLMPVLIVLAAVKHADLKMLVSEVGEGFPILNIVPVAVYAVLALLVAMNIISTPSVSLEGKNIWILQTLPVRGADVMKAKLLTHVLLNGVPGVITAVLLTLLLGGGILGALFSALAIAAFTLFTGAAGLTLGLRHANLTWTNEAYVIKQSMIVLVMMFGGWILGMGLAAPYIALMYLLPPWVYLAILTVFFCGLSAPLLHWLTHRGGASFEKL